MHLLWLVFLEKIPVYINCEIAMYLLEIKCKDFYIILRYVVNTHSWSWEFRKLLRTDYPKCVGYTL